MATHKEIIESTYNCTPPVKTICNIYACGGNSILGGTLTFVNVNGAYTHLTDAQKTKYWDAVHTNVWRLESIGGIETTTSKYNMEYIQKIYDQGYIAPDTASSRYSAETIIMPRLYELYGGSRHIACTHLHANGTGFRNNTGFWNMAVDPDRGSGALTKKLARNLDLTIKHMTAMGYDVRLKGILFIGQSVIDVGDMFNSVYDKATFKTDFAAVIDYFRTTLGYTDVPIYITETTVATEPYSTQYTDAVNELNATLGNIHICYLRHWAVLTDGVHINGATAVNCWGEGAAVGADKNLAELIYSVENP